MNSRLQLAEGQTLVTASGRTTAPFPAVDASTDRRAANSIRRAHAWLIAAASAEASVRRDWFAEVMFRLEDPRRLPQAAADAMADYLISPAPHCEGYPARPPAERQDPPCRGGNIATIRRAKP
jgi:hypothetical protein